MPMLVVAGALLDGEGRVLMHRRPPGKHLADKWEFPGGKVDPGEMPDQALVRELAEELGVTIAVQALSPVGFVHEMRGGEAGNGPRAIVLLLYTCRIWDGIPAALEGGGIGWVEIDRADSLDLAPLDRGLLAQLQAGFAAGRD
ncbi:NTP pyrophosphohydrolase [Croceicoccus mobilis]|uniref:8-oxo-dGTP diphosphatase n=2 Tax=Croceicoccus mobilis TaxID=1703339 RepID=A0A917DXX2_9SPHN|nr:NTP pyrophosphohydrolase [Croceicoccus mobilis]